MTRSYHGAAAVNGKIYLMGGAGADNKPFGSVQVYDPASGRWAARDAMPTPRALFGTSAVGGTIYTIGGTTRGLDKLGVVEAYDTTTDTWSRKADMPTPRSVMSSSVVDGRIYVMGGAFAHGSSLPEIVKTLQILSVVEVYDPLSGRWTRGRDLVTPRGWFGASTVNGEIYLVGGRSPGPDGGTMENVTFPGVEVYTPAP